MSGTGTLLVSWLSLVDQSEPVAKAYRRDGVILELGAFAGFGQVVALLAVTRSTFSQAVTRTHYSYEQTV